MMINFGLYTMINGNLWLYQEVSYVIGDHTVKSWLFQDQTRDRMGHLRLGWWLGGASWLAKHPWINFWRCKQIKNLNHTRHRNAGIKIFKTRYGFGWKRENAGNAVYLFARVQSGSMPNHHNLWSPFFFNFCFIYWQPCYYCSYLNWSFLAVWS